MPAVTPATKPSTATPRTAAEPRPAAATGSQPTAAALPPPPFPSMPPKDAPRDTLAPSSFGTLGASKPVTALGEPRPPRAAMSTIGDFEGANSTATLRPPGAVPPPPRALPGTTPPFEGHVAEREATPAARAEPSSPSAATPAAPVATVVSAQAQRSLDSTLDQSSSASKKAAQAELIERSRLDSEDAPQNSEDAPQNSALPGKPSAVPPPGLFIHDEPVERRPVQPTLVTVPRRELTRLRATLMVLGGLLLLAAGILIIVLARRTDAVPTKVAAPSASAAPPPSPTCALLAPPSRISPIERSVPISAHGLPDGTIALAIADTKTSAAGWIYDPASGEPKRTLAAPSGSEEVSHVSASEPLLVDRAAPDFAFSQTIAPGLALGVGPAGILRRGSDGATGTIWPLAAGVRITPPRVASLPSGHFVAFRQGGAEGQIMTGWLRPDGSAAGEATALEGAPGTLGTPNAVVFGQNALVLFSARASKSEPYRVYAASAAPGHVAGRAQALDLPSDGGGAIAPALTGLSGERYAVQWTDGNVGQYQVHVRLFDAKLEPQGPALLVSAKGANAGQGTLVSTPQATVSFFIQTTAGHDELWGVALSCH